MSTSLPESTKFPSVARTIASVGTSSEGESQGSPHHHHRHPSRPLGDRPFLPIKGQCLDLGWAKLTFDRSSSGQRVKSQPASKRKPSEVTATGSKLPGSWWDSLMTDWLRPETSRWPHWIFYKSKSRESIEAVTHSLAWPSWTSSSRLAPPYPSALGKENKAPLNSSKDNAYQP